MFKQEKKRIWGKRAWTFKLMPQLHRDRRGNHQLCFLHHSLSHLPAPVVFLKEIVVGLLQTLSTSFSNSQNFSYRSLVKLFYLHHQTTLLLNVFSRSANCWRNPAFGRIERFWRISSRAWDGFCHDSWWGGRNEDKVEWNEQNRNRNEGNKSLGTSDHFFIKGST